MLPQEALNFLPKQVQKKLSNDNRLTIDSNASPYIHCRFQEFFIPKTKVQEIEENGELEESQYLFKLRFYGPKSLNNKALKFDDVEKLEKDSEFQWWSLESKAYSVSLLWEILPEEMAKKIIDIAKSWTYEAHVLEKKFGEIAQNRQKKVVFERMDAQLMTQKFTPKETGEETVKPIFGVKGIDKMEVLTSNDFFEETGQGVLLTFEDDEDDEEEEAPSDHAPAQEGKVSNNDVPF